MSAYRRIKALEGRLVSRFSFSFSERIIETAVDCVRICFGLMIIERFVSIAGYAILSDTPDQIFQTSVMAASFGACILTGFATPVALALYVIGFLRAPNFAGTLGDQAAIILSWALILLGAGRRLSLDSLLARYVPLYHRCAEQLRPTLTREYVAKVRTFQIFLFWGLGFSAMTYHFQDQLWIRLRTLHLFFTLPYMSAYSSTFESFRSSAPTLFDYFCRLSLILQSVWELLLFPLALTRWGMVFATFQSLFFFLFCALGFHLGYLPYYELLWWALFFGLPLLSSKYDTVGVVAEGNDADNVMRQSKTLRIATETAMSLGTVSTAYFMVALSFVQLFPERTPGWLSSSVYSMMKPSRFYGQHPINVFNRADLDMGTDQFTIVKRSADGNETRVLPILDPDGSRLSLLRNDLAYFNYSLRWQRATPEARFEDAERTIPTAFTIDMAKRFIRLDRCLRGETDAAQYDVLFFRRTLNESGNAFPSWSKATYVSTLPIQEGGQDSNAYCRSAFRVPISVLGRYQSTPPIEMVLARTDSLKLAAR